MIVLPFPLTLMASASQPTSKRSNRNLALLLLLLPFAGLAAIPTSSDHLRAASLLLRIEDPNDHGHLARYDTYPITETAGELQTPRGAVRARL